MEYLQYIDNSIDSVLKYNTLYTILIVFIITIISVPELYDLMYVFFGIKPLFDMKLKLLYVTIYLLLIVYFTSKDPRIGILGTLLFVSIMHKNKINEINAKLVGLMVENIDQEERLSKLENTNKSIINTANKFIDTPTGTNILNILNSEKIQDDIKKIIINNNASSNLQ